MVCLQPVAAPAVFELGLRYPGVKAVPDMRTDTFYVYVDKACSEKAIPEGADRRDDVDSAMDSLDQLAQLGGGGWMSHKECRDRKPSSRFQYSMGLGGENGQFFKVLSGFHRVTYVECLTCVRKLQRGASLEYQAVRLACDQLEVRARGESSQLGLGVSLVGCRV